MQSFLDAVTQAFERLEWVADTASVGSKVRGFPDFWVALNFTYWRRDQARLIARVRTHRETEGAVNLLHHLSTELALVLIEQDRVLVCSRFEFDPSGRFDPDDELVAYAVFTLDVKGDGWSKVIVDNRRVPFNPIYRIQLVRTRLLATSATNMSL